MINQRVYWHEDVPGNVAKVRELTIAEMERLKRENSKRLMAARSHSDVALELANKYALEHPLCVKVFAWVLSIAYQQEMVAAVFSPASSRVLTERIKSSWKMLVRREDNGRIEERSPGDVTCWNGDDGLDPTRFGDVSALAFQGERPTR